MKKFFLNAKNLIFKNKISMVIAAILAIIFLFGIFNVISSAFGRGDASTISSNQVVSLKKGDVTNAISEKGKAVPSSSVDVFAEKSLPVVNLSVKVGDEVKRGDIIGELDSSSIRQQLDSRKAQKAATDKNISSQISAAKKRLSEAISGRDSGNNQALVSAQNAVTSALDQYLLAQKNYDDYKRSLDERYNEGVVAERSSREAAAYQEEAQNLRYKQQKEDIDKNVNEAAEKRAMAIDKSRQKNSLQNEVDNLKRLSTEKGIQLKEEQERLADAQSKLSELQTNINSLTAEKEKIDSDKLQLEKEIDKLKVLLNSESDSIRRKLLEDDISNKKITKTQIENRSNEIPVKIIENQNKINNLNLDKIKNSANANINRITMEQNEIEIRMNKVSEELGNAKSDQAKYEQEAESLEKELENQSKNIETAKLELEKAREDLQADADKSLKSQKSREDQLKTLEKNVEVAKNNYDAALVTLEATKKQVDNEISSLSDNLNTTRANANNVDNVEIANLTEELDKTLIRATADGTITELNAKEGEVPTGPVAKIETVNTLRIESQVKEYDRNSIKVGTEVEITSDSVLGETFKGKVISIDPVPVKASADNKSGEVYYKTVVELDDNSTNLDKLSPGMTLRVKYILSQVKDTFKVPTDAIFERDGKKYVLALDDIGKNKYETKKIEVTSGISNDVETAISGKGLKDDLKVLTSAGGYGEGTVLKIVESQEATNEK
ncbi:HlyD family efflux transporter periplasmic adaptor subunit [Peptoniphilus sp. MSJ-1]|uniref:HlyD family efflux transporter periplasmic adaptor subunit n=1 Tax=Peptoniphilus ovalis TaxID=2841503 RepID=A0ABS6FK02_9FIRM|nr:HlyD family efflux transporter periplasmic adaptor subunit [Peptoniphilus ovalis]MBU5669793.1 HlyD family efflux transporter periplasmic adaptor subunit [Peptoniphilus ovalis]